MKRIAAALLCALLLANPAAALTDRPFAPLNGTPLVRTQAAGTFTFAVFGDFRPSRRDSPYPAVYRQILEEIGMIAPGFVMSTGDAYYGYGGSFQKFKNEIDYFLDTVRPLGVPLFNAIGNHEVAGNPERASYVAERLGRFYGSFDFGNSHFIMLNTEEREREGAIAGAQLEWLRKDLAANKGAAHIFVFMHRPLLSALNERPVEGAEVVHALFREYKVNTVFAGHEHLYHEEIRDGVRYIITGGGGAPLYQPPQKGGFFHYLLVMVRGGEVTVEVRSPYALQTRNISGNDGFEPKAELEVINISPADLSLRNLSFRMPGIAAGGYRVKAVAISKRENITSHKARMRQVKDNGDGTSTVSVETELPKNGAIRVTVEAGPE
ncbi:MAG TPA: metallophosphoesterase [Dissulfurispiraceae bacterium]